MAKVVCRAEFMEGQISVGVGQWSAMLVSAPAMAIPVTLICIGEAPMGVAEAMRLI